MSFTYAFEYNSKIENLEKLQAFLSDKGIMLDAKYLPVINMAENGDFQAMCEMCSLFAEGRDGVMSNYEMAKRYGQKIHEQNLASEDPVIILESLSNLAMLEAKFGNIEQSKTYFQESFNHMIQNFYNQDVTEESHGFFHHIVEQFSKVNN
ncbi:MAG: hypothetical protein AAFY45_29005 [Bacteroidota bacterium]